jgi:hypothetical protein
MKLIKGILIVLITFLSVHIFAQDVYEVRYSKNAIVYKCLLVEKDNGNFYMRIRYTDKADKVRLVQTDYSILRGSSNGKGYKILKANTPKYISRQDDDNYAAVHLYFSENVFTPWIYFDLSDSKSKIPVERYRKLAKGKVSEAYLKQFFFNKEEELEELMKILEVGEAANPNRFTTLHLIVVANTKITDIGAGCRVDEKNVVAEFENITKTMGITLKTYLVNGDDFNKIKTQNTLDRLSPKPNDIVVYIYRGHGFRWSDQSEPWPQMDLRSGNYGKVSQSTSLGLMQAFNTIRNKNARLNIVLADCCNNDIGINRRTETPLDDLDAKGYYDVEKLKKLFLESRGNIISCAASPGEYSWVNTSKGGFYTLSFIESLRAEVSSKNKSEASWESVMKNTVASAKKKTEKCADCTTQTGKFYSNVK